MGDARPIWYHLSMDKPQRPRDTNQLAKHIVDVATGEIEEETRPKAPGQRKGGLKGGPARAASLTPARRSAIAKKAASTRWDARKK